MTKKSIWLIVGCSVIIITIINYSLPKRNFKNAIDEIRSSTVPMFDSVSKQMNIENSLRLKVVLLIENDSLVKANQIIDSILTITPSNIFFHVYKGMAYAKAANYGMALKEYDSSILLSKTEFPLVLSEKASVYIKLKDYNSAIDNYEKAAVINPDFNLQVANTFNSINKKDSALKYYEIYLMDNPKDTLVMKKIALLSK